VSELQWDLNVALGPFPRDVIWQKAPG